METCSVVGRIYTPRLLPPTYFMDATLRDNHTPAQGIKDLSPPEGVLVPPEGGTRTPEAEIPVNKSTYYVYN